MASDAEKQPSRVFGLTARIWSILALFVVVFLFSQYVLQPSNHSPHRYDPSHLRPKNYLNASDYPTNPFEFCPIYGPGDDLATKYGPQVLAQTRLHLGSSGRIQHLLYRALSGQPVTISVVGGSTSACHGSGDDPISLQCYPSLFFRWWNSVFPHPASELTNGAMRRTNSQYFGFCNAHHIPDATDLVIIELDTDDPPDRDTLEYFELLIRSILIRPDQPAVIILGHFSPQVHSENGFAGPEHWHSLVAQFYDVPHISVKPIIYPSYIASSSNTAHLFVDPVLASPAGHAVLADVLAAYFQSQVCAAWASATAAPESDPAALLAADSPPPEAHGIFGGAGVHEGAAPEKGTPANQGKRPVNGPVGPNARQQFRVPATRIDTRAHNAHEFSEIEPHCVSANDLLHPLPPSLFYGSGWLVHHPALSSSSPLLTAEHYWYSSLPTSRIRVPILVGAGDVGVYYLREPLTEVGEGSAVECWVDDNYNGARVIENAWDVDHATPGLDMIDHFVSRGSHYVECQLLGEEGFGVPMFRMIGIFTT